MREKRQAETGCKQSIYFPGDMLEDIEREAARLDRSSSWVVARCIKAGGLAHVQSLPSDAMEAAE